MITSCAVAECNTPAERKGWCHAHYRRVRLYGSPLEGKPIRPLRPPGLSLEDSFKWWMPGEPPGDDSCWEWKGRRDRNGYGWFRFEGRDIGAHVASYRIYRGDAGKLFVCHVCDNPPCCNPAHLWLGTLQENLRDMVVKGRQARGPHKERIECSVEGCDREATSRGWCLPHWKRWRRHGDPLLGRTPPQKKESPDGDQHRR